MPNTWDKLDRTATPTLAEANHLVSSPLWEELRRWLKESYATEPFFDYSGCVPTGWNLKYRKGGRALCTLYPMEGYFIALVVIGEKEKPAFEQALPTLSEKTRALYEETKDKNGLCWLMLDAREEETLRDIKTCIALRRAPKATA